MKKIILFCAGIIVSSFAIAQDGLFLQPTAAIGIGNIVEHDYGGKFAYKNVMSTNFALGIGYGVNEWRFATGISYLRSGGQVDLITEASFNPQTGGTYPGKEVNEQTYFYHILLPLTASYQLYLSPRISLAPTAGIEVSYNVYEQMKLTGEPGKTIDNKEFTDTHKQLSVWGTANLHLEYAVGNKLSILAGPSFHMMATNFYNVPSTAVYHATQRNYACLFDAGIVWFLHQKTAAPKTDATTKE